MSEAAPPPEDLREQAWLEGPTFLGETPNGALIIRPLSLMTMILSFRFNLTLVFLGGDPKGLTGDEVERQIALYIWMQSAEKSEVLQCARDGSWEAFGKVTFTNGGKDLDLASKVLFEIRRNQALIRASKYKVVGGSVKSSYEPDWVACIVHNVSHERGWSREEILWDMPYSQAVQMNHCALRSSGSKTRPDDGSSAASAQAQYEKAKAAAEKMAAMERDDDEW